MNQTGACSSLDITVSFSGWHLEAKVACPERTISVRTAFLGDPAPIITKTAAPTIAINNARVMVLLAFMDDFTSQFLFDTTGRK